MSHQVYNPATGEVVANVPCMGGRETNDAISSAYDAFTSMRLHFIFTVYCAFDPFFNFLLKNHSEACTL